MKFCYNTNFTLPKQSQRSRSVSQDGSRSFGLFWKEKTPSYNRRNTVPILILPPFFLEEVSFVTSSVFALLDDVAIPKRITVDSRYLEVEGTR